MFQFWGWFEAQLCQTRTGTHNVKQMSNLISHSLYVGWVGGWVGTQHVEATCNAAQAMLLTSNPLAMLHKQCCTRQSHLQCCTCRSHLQCCTSNAAHVEATCNAAHVEATCNAAQAMLHTLKPHAMLHTRPSRYQADPHRAICYAEGGNAEVEAACAALHTMHIYTTHTYTLKQPITLSVICYVEGGNAEVEAACGALRTMHAYTTHTHTSSPSHSPCVVSLCFGGHKRPGHLNSLVASQ